MIRKVKTFLHIFYNSIIPHARYYSKILKVNFSFSLKYFLTLIVILNIFFILSIVKKYSPKRINTVLNSLIISLQKSPDDLIININNGRLITGYNRPYFLWLDDQDKKRLLLVIDETASAKKILIYKSFFLLTTNELVMNNFKNSDLSVLPLSYVQNQQIDKAKINFFVNNLEKIKLLLPFLSLILIIALIIILPLASFIITLIYLLLSTLFVFLLYKIFVKKHFRFKKIFQVSFHSATLPLLIDYGLIIFRPTIKLNFISYLPTLPYPFLFFILLALFIGVGVYEAHVKHE